MFNLLIALFLSLPLPMRGAVAPLQPHALYTPYRFYTYEYVEFILNSLPPVEKIDMWEEVALEEFWDTQV